MGVFATLVGLLAIRATTSTTSGTSSTASVITASKRLPSSVVATTSSTSATLPVVSSTSTSVTSSTTSSSSTLTTSSSTSQGVIIIYRYNLIVQTVFTPPATCTYGGATQMSLSGPDLWSNAVVPASGTIARSCYPPQFWSSATATTTSLPPFKQLICPFGWETYPFNSTYIACCPGGFGLYAPNATYVQRPALNAICTSLVYPGVLLDISSWDSSSLNTVVGATVGVNGTIILATPFDGTVASTTIIPTSSSMSSSVLSSSAQTSSSSSSVVTSAQSTTSVPSSSGVPLSTLP